MLTKEEFSKFAIFQSWQAIFMVFATLNITSYATAKALVKYKDDQDNFITSAQSLTVILVFFVFGIYCMIKFVYGGFSQLPFWIMVLMFIDIISASVFTFWSQIERCAFRYKALVLVSIFTGLFSPGIALVFILYSDKIELNKNWARILGWVIANGLIGLLLYIVNLRRSQSIFSAKYWRYCIGYCFPLIPHFLSAAFLQKIGQISVDRYTGGEKAGMFALANSLAMLMIVINDALTKSLVPWTYQKLAEGKYIEIKKPVNFILVMLAVADLTMVLIAPEVVRVFAGKSYMGAVYAIPPLVAVCYLGFLYNTYSNIEYYFEETKLVSAASIVAGVLVLMLNFTLVPRLGYIAAGYASLISYIIYVIMHYYFMRKTLKKHMEDRPVYDNSFIVKLTALFVVLVLCTPVLYSFMLIRYIILAGACFVVFVKRHFLTQQMKVIMSKRK
jgi:O-antigen/teichoic acid export membrane protein